MTNNPVKIAVLGGTGDLGWGLALQFAKAGHHVIIGSRAKEKADRAVDEVLKAAPDVSISGAANPDAAAGADIVVLTVPFGSKEPTLESIVHKVQGKIFVDTTVPLVPPKVMRVQLPGGGAAAKQTQEFFGDSVRVVSAFQNIAATHLRENDLEHANCDVLVTGNDPDARETVVQLSEEIGLRAWHAGAIDNSAVAEALTSVLIFLNKKYKFDGAGIQITGERKG